MGSLAARHSSKSARKHAAVVNLTVKAFIESVSPATLRTYNKTLQEYYEYVLSLDSRYDVFPTKKGQVCLFATHLFHNGMSPAAIMSKLSAISFVHNMYGKCDPVKSFMMKKIMSNYRKQRPQQDVRMPITPGLLNDMLHAVSRMGYSWYYELLYKSMLSLAFAAFLRISEMTGSTHHLLRNNVRICNDEIVIKFVSYKSSKSVSFVLRVLPTRLTFCPVQLLRRYLQIRGRGRGFLFVKPNGFPMSGVEFRNVFQSLMSFLNMPGTYSPHSLRIGAATHAAAVGYTDAQIRTFGRWSSSAFLNYIRFPVVQV